LRTNNGCPPDGVDADPRAPQNLGALNTGINSGSLVLATFTDENPNAVPSDFLASVAWGDGNSDASADGNGIVSVVQNEDGGFSVIADHTYAAAGTYGITVTVNDTEVNSLEATVTDPVLNASGGSFSGTAGSAATGQVLATFTSANAEAVAADFSASVDWGDGTSNDTADETGTVSIVDNEDGTFSVLGDHAFPYAGSYGIGVTLTDSDGNTTSASLTASVSAAAVTASAGSFSATMGSASGAEVVATFSDANPNLSAGDFIAIVSWGDSSEEDGPISIVQNEDGSFSVVGAHTYLAAGSATITVTILAVDGSSDGTSLTASVGKATPTLSLKDDGGTFNGSAFAATATVAGVIPGVDDTPASSLEGVSLTLTYYAGSSASGDPLSGAPTDPGTYTVVAAFAGSTDYASASVSKTFTIAKAKPVLTLKDDGGTFTGLPYPATATIAGVLSGVDDTPGNSLEGVSLVLTYYAGSSASGDPLEGAPSDPGTYTVRASFAGSTHYDSAFADVTFTIDS